MADDLPTTDQILEELADKAARHIDSMTPVAFESALDEMIRFHRFLLMANASVTADGQPFSYAEIAGSRWRAPHSEWTKQYSRLFERAANRIPDDVSFIRKLAYAPRRLLLSNDDVRYPASIIKGILDLGPLLMHRLESWVTKRKALGNASDAPSKDRSALPGSDAKAYADTLSGVVGAWEELMQLAPILYEWSNTNKNAEEERWRRLGTGWPYVWQHLTNTAYNLAVAVSNEDEPGAAHFRDSLIRWARSLDYVLGDGILGSQQYGLFPDIIQLEWEEAQKWAGRNSYLPSVQPEQVFASLIKDCHNDVMLLTASLLLHWTMEKKQSSDIGARTAYMLLRRELEDASEFRRHDEDRADLTALMLEAFRIEAAGRGHVDGTYRSNLDEFVSMLDRMTERRVVPGRIFTPSTIFGWDELMSSFLAILLAATSRSGQSNLANVFGTLASQPEFAKSDRVLRDFLHELRRLETTAKQMPPGVESAASQMGLEGKHAEACGRLSSALSLGIQAVEEVRLKRLIDAPISLGKVDEIRTAMERELLGATEHIPFFFAPEISRSANRASDGSAELTMQGMEKAQFVEPALGNEVMGLTEHLAGGLSQHAGNMVWRDFKKNDRTQIEIASAIEDALFWSKIADLVRQVGPDPILVVSRSAEGRALRKLVYSGGVNKLGEYSVKRREGRSSPSTYIVTIGTVDIHGADFPAGIAWLFSGRALKARQFNAVDDAGRFVSVEYKAVTDTEGELLVKFKQYLEWHDTHIFEIRVSDPEEEGT